MGWKPAPAPIREPISLTRRSSVTADREVFYDGLCVIDVYDPVWPWDSVALNSGAGWDVVWCGKRKYVNMIDGVI